MRLERLLIAMALAVGCGAPEGPTPDEKLGEPPASQASALTTCGGTGMTFEEAFASFYNNQLGRLQFQSPIGHGSGAVRVSRVDKTEWRGGVPHHTRTLQFNLDGVRDGLPNCNSWRVVCKTFSGRDFSCDSSVSYADTYGGASSECFTFSKKATMKGLLSDKCFTVSADGGWQASGQF